MNTRKILATGILAAASLVTTASAVTTVYISGSTAFRTAASNAITAVVGSTPVAVDSSVTLAAYQGANAQTWSNASYFVQTSWSGSAQGVQGVSNRVTARFLPAAATSNTAADPRNTSNPADTHIPDICFADCQQSSTNFTANSLATNSKVGVVTFIFAASNGFPTGQSMTKQAFEYTFTGLGYVPLSTYNGNATQADAAHSIVYATGRDPDSGTRITTLAEIGHGVANAVTQWHPVINGSHQVTSLATYPGTATINGYTYTSGTGESSGSTLRAFLTSTLTAASTGGLPNGEAGPSYFVTSLGMSDYPKVVTGAVFDTGLTGSDATGLPAVPLNFNGVPFSIANIENGSYTFWGYEYAGISTQSAASTYQSGAVNTFYTSLVSNIQGTATSSLSGNVKESDMQVTRGSDGGPITSKNL